MGRAENIGAIKNVVTLFSYKWKKGKTGRVFRKHNANYIDMYIDFDVEQHRDVTFEEMMKELSAPQQYEMTHFFEKIKSVEG